MLLNLKQGQTVHKTSIYTHTEMQTGSNTRGQTDKQITGRQTGTKMIKLYCICFNKVFRQEPHFCD